jgi:IclR family pca regulon transcriptional regulator
VSESSGHRRPRQRVAAAEREPAHGRHSVSVDRGFAILERFDGKRSSESLAEIATSVQLPRSSVHRYLQTLAVLGLVEQRGTPGRRYRLTPVAASPGAVAIAATGLPQVAHHELAALRRKSGCTARLAVRTRLDALLVDQAVSLAPGQQLPALDARPGTKLGEPACALRQALLAHLDLDALPTDLRRRGRAVHKDLARVRERGVATQDDANVCAIAMPIFVPGRDEAIAAIDLVGAAPQVTPAVLAAQLDQLRATAERLAPAIAELPWAQWRPYKRRTAS